MVAFAAFIGPHIYDEFGGGSLLENTYEYICSNVLLSFSVFCDS